MMANSGIPFEAVQARIAATVHAIFFIQQKNGQRRLSEICRVTGFDRASGRYRTEETTA
jgi:pilus assembly protein CpaF